jgi:hypothetical protein
MQSKHRREEGLSSATHQNISARVFMLTECCGILTSVFLSVMWILLGQISFTRINEYSMHEAANEILYSWGGVQQSCGCSKHNKMEDQSKFEYTHT